ncbi:GNAT family N-acetyltransferase [Martelella mediterranea]|uniref:GNAT family N-acetyltransferase n=1 Tax=Martelella mediterranea TaxID=293089 RepID=UPI001E64D258|nr:GNAT family N-acetyltransferase [Martelella mediterranea]MCD1634791.1 GNAT family N-acetyltransferase [Martelella mediterranea]
MAPTEAILSEDDLAGAMALSAEAGWNQTEDDWRLFLRHGSVFGIFEGATLVASAAIMPYGKEFAWISMVLTRQDRRGNGYGTRLLKHCIAVLESENRTALLDATPAGEVLYRKLGFSPVARFTRWQGIGGGLSAARQVDDAREQAIALANRAFGAEREHLLCDFARRAPALCRFDAAKGLAGFGRDGRLATQIGPLVGPAGAIDGADAEGLLTSLIDAIHGPVFLDLSDQCPRLADRLAAKGFEKQRPLLRMKHGRWAQPQTDIGTAVIAGPEFG